MSDSPLDGGSGWPTSAYAIVPRQPAAPRQETAPGPDTVPDKRPPADESEPLPEPLKKGRIIALIVGLIVLVIAAVGGVLATRGTSATDGVDSTSVTAPATDAPAGLQADPSPSVTVSAGADASSGAGATSSAGASAGASGSPVPGLSGTPDPAVLISPLPEGTVTEILHSGTVRLAVLLGQPDDVFDFDAGLRQSAGADIAAGAIGLSAGNGAQFAVLTTADTPSLAACSAVPAAQWTGQVLLAALVPGAKVCVRTSDQRFAWFTPRGGDALVSGALYTTYLDFIVYKKSGD
jgi:hypothetical protein